MKRTITYNMPSNTNINNMKSNEIARFILIYVIIIFAFGCTPSRSQKTDIAERVQTRIITGSERTEIYLPF
ncbi:MAG: hypothetical protein ACI9FN_000327, partial [Saprospiraceae bacterium]